MRKSQTKEKTVKLPDTDITQAIYRMAVRFEKEHGIELEAFLIGPLEYAALFKVCREMFWFTNKSHLHLSEVDKFMGMKIRLKASPGIEPEFPTRMWTRLV